MLTGIFLGIVGTYGLSATIALLWGMVIRVQEDPSPSESELNLDQQTMDELRCM
uniref:Uncharacterized protein n=1 Tax=Cyanothece sp. (strain PCC 7425 / ATCC 29141) TaxID=395961 RepID=B8HWZ0_CYAP4